MYEITTNHIKRHRQIYAVSTTNFSSYNNAHYDVLTVSIVSLLLRIQNIVTFLYLKYEMHLNYLKICLNFILRYTIVTSIRAPVACHRAHTARPRANSWNSWMTLQHPSRVTVANTFTQPKHSIGEIILHNVMLHY